MSYDNVLYFAVSRDFDNKEQIYGKFGNHKVGGEKARFAAYNTVNPSYRYVAVRYNQSIIENTPSECREDGAKAEKSRKAAPHQHQYLDNYINQTVLFKNSAKPLVRFKCSDISNMHHAIQATVAHRNLSPFGSREHVGSNRSMGIESGVVNTGILRYTDWFALTEHAAKNILYYMIQLNSMKPYNKLVPLDNRQDYVALVQAICTYLQINDERLIQSQSQSQLHTPPVFSFPRRQSLRSFPCFSQLEKKAYTAQETLYSDDKVRNKGCFCAI